MCGIFGYVGSRSDAPKIVFDGLKKLEYRGYDSWGIVAKVESQSRESKLLVDKSIGKIGNSHSSLFSSHSSLALGHTRWATHGGVTKLNAHPHLDCTGNLAIVHNGIIENYLDLKADLIKKGHNFKSETDTEVMVHLVEEYFKNKSLMESVRLAFSKISGLNAFIFISKDHELVAVKNGSPVIVGIGKGENFISSDSASIVSQAKKVVFIEDGEIVTVSGEKVCLIDAKSGKVKELKIEELDFVEEEITLGKYAHFMIKEIFEQPKVLGNISKNASYISSLAGTIKKSKGTFFIGCGTASYAALAGTYLFSKIAKKHINFSIGSEFGYLEDYLNNKSLVIALSQSGETVDVVQPVLRAKKKGAKVVALTNVVGSALYRAAHEKIFLEAGVEKAVCATKSYCAMVANLILLAFAVGGKVTGGKKVLAQTKSAVKKVLSKKSVVRIKNLAKRLSGEEDIYIIGRGISYACALEASLKIKEVSYIHSEGFAGGELKHGVIALIRRGTACIVFAPMDETYSDVISNAIEIKARGGYIIGVSAKDNPAFDFHIAVSDCGAGSVIAQTVPIQLLTYFMALERGLDPDMPRNLAKSVTVK